MNAFVKHVLVGAGLYVACLVAQYLSIQLRFPSIQISVLWLPGPVALAALCFLPHRYWPVAYAGMTGALVSILVRENGYLIQPAAPICAFLLLGLAELVRRFDHPGIGFERFQSAMVFLVSTVMVTAVAAASLSLLGFTGPQDLPVATAFPAIFVSLMLGILTFTPTLIWLARLRPGDLARTRLVEPLLIGFCIVFFMYLLYGAGFRLGTGSLGMAYAPLPIALWAAVRFGLRGAGLTLGVAVVSATLFALDHSTSADPLMVENTVRELQIEAVVATLPLMLLGSLVSERRLTTDRLHAERLLLDERLRFEQLVTEISAQLSGSLTSDLNPRIHAATESLCLYLGVRRGAIYRVEGDLESLARVFAYSGTEETLVPERLTRERFPWFFANLPLTGTSILHYPESFPPEATDERDFMLKNDIASILMIPLTAGGKVGFVAGFLSVRERLNIRPELIPRIRTAGEIIAGAIMRLEYERDLLEAIERAEQAARIKASLLSNMSHEIRTPLTSIIGFSDVLAMEVGSKHQEFLRIISEGGHRLLNTLDSVLELTRLESGAGELTLTRVDITEVASNVATLLSFQAEAKNLRFDVAIPDDPVYVQAHAASLERVLNNLLGNAIKFTEEGGVTLKVEPRPETVMVVIADTGIGISDDFLPYIYDEFAQESVGIRRSYEGAGLGLTLTYRLVERMKGHIRVETAKGLGTTFFVELTRLA